MPTFNVAYFNDLFDGITAKLAGVTKELGEGILLAKTKLSAADYEEVEARLLVRFTKADLLASVAVAEGKLDPGLFPAATRSSKVMTLSPADQARLLSDEKFPVYDAYGTEVNKTWAEMTADERDRLLGPKGGKLHAITEQRRPDNTRTTVIVRYDSATYQNGRLRLAAGASKRGEIEVDTLVGSLTPTQLEEFSRALSAMPVA